MSHFAVLDTETTWSDEVMSLGFVIADEDGFEEVCGEYYIVDPVYKRGGMYSFELIQPGVSPAYCSREDVIEAVRKTFREKQVEQVFAYNAALDKRHLTEPGGYVWYDIMKLAAYRQYNPKIPDHMEFCRTGRLKRGLRVGDVTGYLTDGEEYEEMHNALTDARDELRIMKLLRHPIHVYECARI